MAEDKPLPFAAHTQALMDSIRRAGFPPISQQPVEMARKAYAAGVGAMAHPPVPLPRVEPFTIPGPAGDIPARLWASTHDKDLPRGQHPFQLYSQGTPNGQKVTILFEELLEAGHDAEYDAWTINISGGDQFSGDVFRAGRCGVRAVGGRGRRDAAAADLRLLDGGGELHRPGAAAVARRLCRRDRRRHLMQRLLQRAAVEHQLHAQTMICSRG